MRCTVYRSSRKEFTYLYLADTMKIEDLPESLIELFGEPETVLRLDFTKVDKLAHADPEGVEEGLREDGC